MANVVGARLRSILWRFKLRSVGELGFPMLVVTRNNFRPAATIKPTRAALSDIENTIDGRRNNAALRQGRSFDPTTEEAIASIRAWC
jgi:hypothetical protein